MGQPCIERREEQIVAGSEAAWEAIIVQPCLEGGGAMQQRLDMRQHNNLITGNDLAADLPATSPERRAFVVVGAYRDVGRPGGARVSRFLNADQSDVRFWLRKYEVDELFIQHGWWPGEGDLQDAVFIKGIPSIEALEAELAHYLDDFAGLGSTHDNPL
jgi:hypothetical protein